MTSKPPTAEEVLGLYQKAQGKDGTNDDYLAFHQALRAWRESQGPVTREWFHERFGGTSFDNGDAGLVWLHDGAVTLGVRIDGERWYYTRLVNPTRSKIEALVEMLGGTDAS